MEGLICVNYIVTFLNLTFNVIRHCVKSQFRAVHLDLWNESGISVV